MVRGLRSAGFEVLSVSEYTAQSINRDLIDQAYREQRILITEDKDFGWLVFVSQARSAGVILIRYPGNARSRLAPDVISLVQERGAEMAGAFVVMQPGYIRISRQP